MLVVLLFTAMILISVLTRSIMVVWVCMLIVLVVLLLKKKHIKTVFVYFLSMLSGLGSVIVYDTLIVHWTSTVSALQTFRVIEQQRINRYLIEVKSWESALSEDRWQDKSQLLLYSTASLEPGDLIQSSRTIIQRKYDEKWCWRVCIQKNRQNGQIVDNESFDYDAWLYIQGFDGSVYDNNPYIVWQEAVSTRMQLKQYIKHTIVKNLWSDTVWALWLGMLIGDRSLFHKDEYQSFIDSWLIHLVAVSGWNIAIMVALASLLLFWLPFYIRIVVLILVVVAYSYLVGTDSSVVRATIMALLTLFALLPGRQISIWRLLAYAWILMLLRNPYYLLYDLWFLLSFWALLGIIWADRVVFQKLKGKISWQIDDYGLPRRSSSQWHIKVWEINKFSSSWWKEQLWNAFRILILPSIGAMVGVLPVLIRHTGQINLFWPLLNMVIVPFVSLITILLIVLTLLSWWWIATLLTWLLSMIISLSLWWSQYSLLLYGNRFAASAIWWIVVLYWIWWIRQEVECSASDPVS